MYVCHILNNLPILKMFYSSVVWLIVNGSNFVLYTIQKSFKLQNELFSFPVLWNEQKKVPLFHLKDLSLALQQLCLAD